jgi:hypothetical protein
LVFDLFLGTRGEEFELFLAKWHAVENRREGGTRLVAGSRQQTAVQREKLTPVPGWRRLVMERRDISAAYASFPPCTS